MPIAEDFVALYQPTENIGQFQADVAAVAVHYDPNGALYTFSDGSILEFYLDLDDALECRSITPAALVVALAERAAELEIARTNNAEFNNG